MELGNLSQFGYLVGLEYISYFFFVNCLIVEVDDYIKNWN